MPIDSEQEFNIDFYHETYLSTFFVSGIVSAVLRLTFIHPKNPNNDQPSIHPRESP